MTSTTVRTTCPYCGVGCGILARADGLGGAVIEGDPEHPSNFGRLCSKGSALGETLGLSGRLLHPMAKQPDGNLARVSWDTALDRVAEGFLRIRDRYGPQAIAFYLSGQLLTEDYYVANKLMKGFLGSANVDTNSRLCMASTVAGHRRAFGADVVPGVYADLDEVDLIVLVGSNAAWCHPVLFQRMRRNRERRGAKIVVIDPRRTATAEEADLFLGLSPGSDTALFSGLLAYLADSHTLDFGYIDRQTEGFENALAWARAIASDVPTTAAATGLDPETVRRFFDLFRTTERVVTCFSQGVNQSAQGTDKVNAIINCHLATGRIGRPGMGPFSLTGQPNAMGGREVGGLANQLAAHMDFSPDNVDRVQRFWSTPAIATREGLKAVQMFEAIERGEIRALWVMGTNPAVSLPRAGAARDALRRLELFVVSENVLSNDTVTAGAQVLLPAAAWGEKDGTVTNSERRISRQRSFLPLPGEAKPDWWIVSEVARRMGFGESFTYGGPADIFREHAALSAFENGGERAFDIGAFGNVSEERYDALDPFQWPRILPRETGEGDRPKAGGGGDHEPGANGRRASHGPSPPPQGDGGGYRFFANGGFFTADGKARFVAPAMPSSRRTAEPAFPFRLNTGRVRDQWHTMTRTGLSPRLALHQPEPLVEVNPGDAKAGGLRDGGFARVSTRHGAATLKVTLSDGQRRGSLFVPIHWSNETASSARIGELVGPETDPHSGQPDSKATPAAIAPVAFTYRGFVLARALVSLPSTAWWARVALEGGFGYLLASDDGPEVWADWIRPTGSSGEIAEYADLKRDTYRAAVFVGSRLETCLFLAPADAEPQWEAVRALFREVHLPEFARRVLLSGQPHGDMPDAGPLVCACFGVGLKTIRDALASGVAANTEAIGSALRAGTNCGSCLPEIRRLLSVT